MSLHKFAEQVASQGRGDDSLLVHMTPEEVRNLQKFAEANGTTLTINPVTGLPEAGMLSDLFKTIAPIALGALLGPAGFGLSATMAGVATGGITALATGSLSRGLMAGLGAYGGAGLADSFMNAGAGAGLSEALAGSSSGNLGQSFGDVASVVGDGSSGQAFNQFLTSNANPATQSFGDMASAGAKAVADNPMDFAKNNLKYLAAAASPIMADMMTPTTTKMPEMGNTGYIRQKVYDPYTQTYRSMAPVKANEWGDRQFSDIHRGYNGGGIVALAGGGRFSTVQEGDEYDQYDDGSAAAAATKAAADTAAAAVVTPPQGIATLAQPGANANQLAANTQFVQQAAQPDTTSAQFVKATADANIVNQDLADALGASGLSAASQYALLNANVGDGGGLLGLSQNINKALTDPNLTLTQAQGLMTASGTTDADVLRATGRASSDIFATRAADAEAKAAAERNAAAAAASKLSADRAAAEKLAADKAAADKFAADKAAADKASAEAQAKAAIDAQSKTLADKAAAEKAAAEKANADRIAAAIAADEKAAADRAAAAKAAADAKIKKVADEDAAGRTKGAADKAAYEKYIADAAAAKAAADKLAREKAIADKAIADKAAADKRAADAAAAKVIADKAAADKIIADKAAADKAAADAARKIVEDRLRTCPAPDMRILLANGDLKAAGELQVGDVVKTQHEHTLEWGEYPVTHVSVVPDAVRLKFNFDSVDFVCSLDHKFFKAADKWVEAKNVCVGDMLSGQTVRGIEQAEVGDVIRITIDNAHTYICEGLLSHNKTPKPPTPEEIAAAADKARREAEAIAKAAADKAIADALVGANKVSSIGVVDLLTDTGVSQDKTDTTTTGTNTLATTTPGSITSNITTDGQYIGTTGATPAVGTKVGTGTIAGTGTETTTGTTGPIIDYGGTAGFKVAPLTLAQTDIAAQAAATNAAQNTQLDLYRSWVNQNPNATDIQHANFLDKINLSPDVAARATPLSGQQMKNRYYDAKYNKQTGDSQAAYNFLMGKGAYPTKSGVGEIARPYSEATLGMPASTNKKYIFDPTTRSYKLNQDYVGTTRDSTGAVNYTMSPKDIYNYFVKNAGQADSKTYDWAIENNLTPEEIAAATNVPLSTVAAKWRDAKAAKDKAAKDATKTVAAGANTVAVGGTNYNITDQTTPPPEDNNGPWQWSPADKKWIQAGRSAGGGLMGFAMGGMPMYAVGGGLGALGSYSDGGRLLRGPGDGVSDSIPATIGRKQQPARLADGEFVVPARIVSELGNGSTEAGAKKLYAMMDRVQRARGKTTGKDKVAANSRADKYLPA